MSRRRWFRLSAESDFVAARVEQSTSLARSTPQRRKAADKRRRKDKKAEEHRRKWEYRNRVRTEASSKKATLKVLPYYIFCFCLGATVLAAIMVLMLLWI